MKISHILIFSLFAVLLFAAVSCTDEEYSLGSELVSPDAHLTLIDTCTIEMETIMADSFQTSAKSVALVGRYRNSDFGLTSAYSYMTFATSSASALTEAAVFDSITLTLHTSTVYYGDTMQSFDFTIHQLKNTVELDADGIQYNKNTVAYNETPIATAHFRHKPVSSEKYEIRLANSIGQDFFDKIQTSDPLMDESKFTGYFHGLAFVPSAKENGSIAGFTVSDTAVHINVYYHYVDDVKSYGAYTFYLDNDADKSSSPIRQFNHFEYDWSNKLLATLKSNSMKASSSKTNNQVYISTLHGMTAQIKFPYITELNHISKYSEITVSNLVLKPVSGTYTDQTPLPPSLYIYTLDVADQVLSALKEGTTSTLQTGSLATDYVFGINTTYTFTTTSYLTAEIARFGVNAEHLEIQIPSTSDLQTLVLGDARHSKNAIKSNLYLLKYDASTK